MPHQGPFQQLRSAVKTGVHLRHERVHAVETDPPALPGQGPVPELISPGGDACAAALVSARCSPLPIPPRCCGNGHSRGAETRARGLGGRRLVLLDHHLPYAGRATGSELGSRAQPWLPQPWVIRASLPLHAAGRALAEPWSRGGPAN